MEVKGLSEILTNLVNKYQIQNFYDVGCVSSVGVDLAVSKNVGQVFSFQSLAFDASPRTRPVNCQFVDSPERLQVLYNSILQEDGPVRGIETLLVTDRVNFLLASPLVKLGYFAIIPLSLADAFDRRYWTVLEQKALYLVLQKINFLSHVTADTFIVATPTYDRRPTRETLPILLGCIQTVKAQTYKNCVHLIVGDHYADTAEFDQIENSNNLFLINLPFAMEREILRVANKLELWQNAGRNTINYGLWLISQTPGIIARLDDDDRWTPNHLELLAKEYQANGASCAFVFTNAWGKPPSNLPKCAQLYHSSVSWKPQLLPLKYHVRKGMPCDGHMWNRLSEFMQKHKLVSVRIPIDTVNYDRTNSKQVLGLKE